MREFVFLNENSDEIPLDDSIESLNLATNDRYLVSNSPKLNAEIYAKEINFYLKNSTENALVKSKNTLKLYEARASGFDLSMDVDLTKEIGKNILFVSDNDESEAVSLLAQNGFKVIKLSHNEVKFIYGEIGELLAVVLRDNDEFEIDFSILLVKNAKDYMLRQSGCFEVANLASDEILSLVNSVSPVYNYKRVIDYDANICQYKGRRTLHCAKCVDVCPTVAIMKNDETKELVFSHIDCVSCGACVSVCPSGSLDFNFIPRRAFGEVLELYKDSIILVIDDSVELESLRVNLKPNVLPLFVKSLNFLGHEHLMELVCTSGASVVLFGKEFMPPLNEALNLVNEIYEKIHQTKAVYKANDLSSLNEALNLADFIENSKQEIVFFKLQKREIFAKYLLNMIKDEDYGKTSCGELLRYGKVEINTQSCTLCLSCVGACNVGALYADKSDNSIKFNASLCTTCGYCETSCAESETIKVVRDGMELKKSYFEYQTLAQDELFKCVECGKEFATVKSVKKIATLLEASFASDPDKLKTLYCCGECKAKLMLKKQIENGDFDE